MKKISLIFTILIIYLLNIALTQAPAIEWQNTIGGSDWDKLYSIKQTIDGGYILGGYSQSDISGDKTVDSQGGDDYWVVKLDNTGNVIWDKTIGGDNYDELQSIQQTADGGYILGGYSQSDISGDKTEACQGSSDYWVIKLDGVGNILWQNTIGGNGTDWLYSICQTTDGGYILGGYSISGISGDKTEKNIGLSYDYWVVKLDGTGQTMQWQNTIGASSTNEMYSIQQTTDGGYILGGYSNSGVSGDKTETCRGEEDYWVVKLDKWGNVYWQKTIGGNYGDKLQSIIQTMDGGYVLGGHSNSGISGDKTDNSKGGADYWVVKLEADAPLAVKQTPLATAIESFTVLPAYPNPFNPSTTITYGLDTDSKINIVIYDITGQLINTLQNGNKTQGWHSATWSGTNQNGDQSPAGLYFSRITSGNEVKTTKLMLLK
ncbi:T9SS type A sorting domain-containing protein [bacterium]|nr:T9SS type A sorting domain-containing protein [bacterium]